jgi:hypothetical protein
VIRTVRVGVDLGDKSLIVFEEPGIDAMKFITFHADEKSRGKLETRLPRNMHPCDSARIGVRDLTAPEDE